MGVGVRWNIRCPFTTPAPRFSQIFLPSPHGSTAPPCILPSVQNQEQYSPGIGSLSSTFSIQARHHGITATDTSVRPSIRAKMLIDAYIWGFLHCSFKNKTNGKTIKKDPELRSFPQLKVIYSCGASVLLRATCT